MRFNECEVVPEVHFIHTCMCDTNKIQLNTLFL